MNLETALDPKLWAAVRTSVESRNHSASILDAIHFLSDVVREKSGLEGDGVSLIGAAFGGDSPKLKVNKLQTESERNVQKGVEALLRGVFQAIRNPRSHGPTSDEERDAVAVILFLDYLLRIVDKSRTPFSMSVTIGKILDPAFAPLPRYVELIVREIPERKRLDVCRELFARREDLKGTTPRLIFDALMAVMSDEDKAHLFETISEELSTQGSEDTVRFILKAFDGSMRPLLSEMARLRSEHMIIRSIEAGRYNEKTQKCMAGGLGTWATGIFQYITLREDFWKAVFQKLEMGRDVSEKDYSFHYFASSVNSYFATPPWWVEFKLKAGVKAGDKRYKALVESWGVTVDEDTWTSTVNPEDPWRKPFIEVLAAFEEKAESTITDDDIPF